MKNEDIVKGFINHMKGMNVPVEFIEKPSPDFEIRLTIKKKIFAYNGQGEINSEDAYWHLIQMIMTAAFIDTSSLHGNS